MADHGRVVTTKLDDELVEQLDAVAERIERSKSWIIREALEQWLADERRRYELTLEALLSVDAGRTIGQAEVEAHFKTRRQKRTRTAPRA